MEIIPQAIASNRFKDIAEVGGGGRNTLSWGEECNNKEQKLLNVDPHFGHFLLDIRQQICKFVVDGFPILVCEMNIFT